MTVKVALSVVKNLFEIDNVPDERMLKEYQIKKMLSDFCFDGSKRLFIYFCNLFFNSCHVFQKVEKKIVIISVSDCHLCFHIY